MARRPRTLGATATRSRRSPLLATLRIPAVLFGVGAGSLVATVVALVLGLVLGLLDQPADAGLVPAIVVGLGLGGWVAGRGARVSHRFHGSVAGLVVVGLVVAVARLGGSPAPTGQVLALAALGIVVGGVGGALGGRRSS